MFDKVFGASWKTSAVGYALSLLGTVYTMLQTGAVMPKDLKGWAMMGGSLLLGVWGRVQKDTNVSNAPVPAEAKPVV